MNPGESQTTEPATPEAEALHAPGKRSSVRTRLLLLFVGTLVLNGAILLGVGGVALVNTSAVLQENLETALREGVELRGELLVRNHATALSPLVADNSFGSVEELIEKTVQEEKGLVTGFFREADGRVWVLSEREKSLPPQDERDSWIDEADELVTKSAPPTKTTQLSSGQSFRGEPVLVARSSVFDDEDEHMGDVVYVFSTAPIRAKMEASRAQAGRLTKNAGYSLGALGLLSILAALALVTRLARRLTSPLELLRASPEKVTAGGDWTPVEVNSRDELGLLADAFNKMVSQNAETMVELRKKTDDALAAARMKSEFLANMSHEIRTPMNGILGVSRLAQQRQLDGTMRRYVETINSSAQSLLTIINDVLDFSKLEAGKYTVTQVPYDLRSTIAEVAQLHAGKAQEKGVRMINRTSPEIARSLLGDPDRIRQILGNLLSNAVKFTARGEIIVEALIDGTGPQRTLSLSVRDTGAGIAEGDLEELFQAFHQVDGSLSRSHGGTGLGLAISRGLAEVMGGEIKGESQEDVGSIFTVRLPYLIDNHAALSQDSTWATGKRALIVEDHPLWQQILRENMQAWGLETQLVTSADEAEENIIGAKSTGRPHELLVVGALRGPRMAHLLEKIEKGEHQIAVIVLCQPGEEEDAEPVREYGQVLPKPLQVSELYNSLQAHFTGDEHQSSRVQRAAVLQSSLPVLVVDDNEINRFVASEQLAEIGLSSEVAENGLVAFEKVKEGKYLAVLMDCQMPVMDGYTATRAIRQWEAEENQPRTLIVALTAHAMAGERTRVQDAGMDDYLSKPAQETALARMLVRHIGAELETSAVTRTRSARPQSSDAPILSPDVNRSARLISLFKKSFPEQIQTLERELQSAEKAEAASIAHKLKGTLAAFGASRAHQVAVDLDLAAKGEDWPTCYELLVQLDVEGASIEAEIARMR